MIKLKGHWWGSLFGVKIIMGAPCCIKTVCVGPTVLGSNRSKISKNQTSSVAFFVLNGVSHL